jgi:enoyl-CoA hydratase
MGDRVRLETANAVCTVRIDHPPLNTFDTELRRELSAVAHRLADDPEVRAVILYGGERVFAAGADIRQLAGMGYEEIVGWNRAMQGVLTRIATLPMPVVAAVNGFALGGGMELALCADYRVAAADATFGQPEVLLGIMPGSGGTQRLCRLIGPSRAKELLMTGRRVTAAEALGLGLADRVVAAGDAYAAAHEYASGLARGPRLALEAIKEAVDRGGDAPIESGLALERMAIAGLFATGDKRAGMASFLAEGPGHADFG